MTAIGVHRQGNIRLPTVISAPVEGRRLEVVVVNSVYSEKSLM